MRVCYEELCLDPRKVIGQISEFMELSGKDPNFFRYAESTLQPVASVNPFRLNKIIERPFHETALRLGYKGR
jgi:hypothetical protein